MWLNSSPITAENKIGTTSRWPRVQLTLYSIAIRLTTLTTLTVFLWVASLTQSGAAQPRPNQTTPTDVSGLSFDVGAIADWLWGSRSQTVVNSLAQPENVSYRHAAIVRDIADRWLKYTKYGGVVRVNQPPSDGSLTILLLKSAALKKIAPQYMCIANIYLVHLQFFVMIILLPEL